MLTGGYVTAGRIRGVPIRVHATTPMGLFVFSGLTFNLLLWAGLFVIILVHELGHAILVRRYRLTMVSIDITGIGGVCRWSGRATDVQESVIAWGGVLAQAVFVVLLAVVAVTTRAMLPLAADIAETLIYANLALMVVNILPLPRLDGAKAWMLFRWRNLSSWGRRGSLKYRAAAIERELAELTKHGEVSDAKASASRFVN